MTKSINLLDNPLHNGRYVKVEIDTDFKVKVSAVWIEGFRQEPYESNGAVWIGYHIAPLDPDMKRPATDPRQEVILFGQHVMDETKRRFFPFDVQNYVWLTEFETLGGKAFFEWNEEAFLEPKQAHKPRLARGVQMTA